MSLVTWEITDNQNKRRSTRHESQREPVGRYSTLAAHTIAHLHCEAQADGRERAKAKHDARLALRKFSWE